jgi:excisionase family DNA binding protein
MGLLTLGEAAAKLGLGRSDLEALIGAGKIQVVQVGEWTRMVPTTEVERLAKHT